MIVFIVFLSITLLIGYAYFMAMITETQQEEETPDRPADGEAYRQELARVKARRNMQLQEAMEREKINESSIFFFDPPRLER